MGAEQTKTKAVKDIEALYLRVEQSPCKISAPVREWQRQGNTAEYDCILHEHRIG